MSEATLFLTTPSHVNSSYSWSLLSGIRVNCKYCKYKLYLPAPLHSHTTQLSLKWNNVSIPDTILGFKKNKNKS